MWLVLVPVAIAYVLWYGNACGANEEAPVATAAVAGVRRRRPAR